MTTLTLLSNVNRAATGPAFMQAIPNGPISIVVTGALNPEGAVVVVSLFGAADFADDLDPGAIVIKTAGTFNLTATNAKGIRAKLLPTALYSSSAADATALVVTASF
jgi:hypothetical protein